MKTLGKHIDEWLGYQVNFGGEWMSRAAVLDWFKQAGLPRRPAELWLLGYERTHQEVKPPQKEAE